jgi:Ca2+:H+ antiporter
MSAHALVPKSAWIFPALALLLFAAVMAARYEFTASYFGLLFAALLLIILFGTVFAAVHHAEIIAHRIGEPYGTLLLTLAVTIIEVTLIATIMLGEQQVPTLARDTVFAVVMIVCTAWSASASSSGACIIANRTFKSPAPASISASCSQWRPSR